MCLSVCLSAAACLHYCTDPDVTWGSDRECPLVVHYWADLQSVNRLHCYGNIARTRNVSEYMPILALCLVIIIIIVSVRRIASDRREIVRIREAHHGFRRTIDD